MYIFMYAKQEVYYIHHNKRDVVLMSEDEYESLLETLELLSTPEFKKKQKK